MAMVWVNQIWKWIYLHGPEALMWGGMTEPEVCARLTGVNEAHWEKNVDPCDELIQRKCTAMAVAAGIALFGWGMFLLSAGAFLRWGVIIPIVNNLQKSAPPTQP